MPTELLHKRVSLLNPKRYLTYDDVLLLPAYSEVTPPETSLETSLSQNISLKIPILAAPMDTVCEKEMALALSEEGGLGVIHRNMSIEEQVKHYRWVQERRNTTAVAIGVGPDFIRRVAHLVECGAKLFCLDSAHGHSKQVIEAVHHIKENYPGCEVMAGNVVTYEGASALFEAGADMVKVGVGPGSICTTRIVAGVGAPQLTAVIECAQAAQEYNKTIIADGGIKTSGDIVKALAAGAQAVMLGSLIAGTAEAPGEESEIEGKRYKTYRGMGSAPAMKQGSATRYGLSLTKPLAPQGIEGRVPYKGSLHEHLYPLLEGIRAGLAYVGARTIAELPQKGRFIRQSSAGLSESYPHTIEIA